MKGIAKLAAFAVLYAITAGVSGLYFGGGEEPTPEEGDQTEASAEDGLETAPGAGSRCRRP